MPRPTELPRSQQPLLGQLSPPPGAALCDRLCCGRDSAVLDARTAAASTAAPRDRYRGVLQMSGQRDYAGWEALRDQHHVPCRGGRPSTFELLDVPVWLSTALARDDAGIAPKTDNTSTRDGLMLHYRQWLPATEWPSKRRPVVVYIHGMAGHPNSANITEVGERLSSAGIAVFAMDNQSHGHSEGHGKQVVLSFLDIIGDLMELLEIVCQKVGSDAQIIISGESLGGALGLLLALRLQGRNAIID